MSGDSVWIKRHARARRLPLFQERRANMLSLVDKRPSGARPLRSARYSSLSFLAEREYPFRLVDRSLGTSVGVAQESFRSGRMRADARVATRHRLPERGPDHFFSERDKGAAQTGLHFPAAAAELRGQFLGQVFLLPVGTRAT